MRKKKAWVVAVDMGYGHQRAAHSLLPLALKKALVSADDYLGIPATDKVIWQETRQIYEFISRFKKVPLLGDFVFALMDKIQEIKPFYPKEKPIEPPGFQLRAIYQLMEKKHWGKHLVRRLNRKPLPFLATFPVPAFMAEYWGYAGPIFLVVTDSDAARTWVPLSPKGSKIHYCAPTQRVAERLLQYGIPKEQISLTGFPLPLSLVDQDGFLRTKEDLRRRLARLDPKRTYLTRYADVVRTYLGSLPKIQDSQKPITLTFAIGGAGAQKGLGKEIMLALAPLLKKGEIVFQLVVGTQKDTADFFFRAAKELGLSPCLKRTLKIFFSQSKDEYFREFEEVLRNTDILWTKPSELCFYAGLGIPILLAPPIGSQEEQNKKWLLKVGAAIEQQDPRYAADWIMDYLNQGLFAEAAMQGFVEIERNGTKNIGEIIQTS